MVNAVRSRTRNHPTAAASFKRASRQGD
jgi:hypothetical protein